MEHVDKWKWTERKFNFDFPPAKMPELIERLAGAPPRLEEMTRPLREDELSFSDGGWSIKQNIGHLIDTEFLPLTRIDQILDGQRELIAADMENKKTWDANHNARPLAELLDQFRSERGELVFKLRQVPPQRWGDAAVHPRIQQDMRIVDIAYFTSEHDDYHLARIRQLIQAQLPLA